MLGVWLSFTIASVALLGGLTSPTIGLYVLVIIFAGLMLGVKSAIFFAGMTFAVVSLMFIGELLDVMPVALVNHSPLRTLFVHALSIIITAVLVRQAVRDINRSKAQADQRAQELEQFIASMEETIARRTYEINEQKTFFETLFANIPVAVVSVAPDNKVVACNQSFEELFGYQQSEVLGQVLDPLVTTEETQAEAESYTHQTQGGVPTQAICKRKRKDDSLVDVEMRGVPIVINDRHVGALAIYHDITAKLLAEETLKADESRFRSLFEDSPISLWEEDFSDLKKHLEHLRSTGISDFQKYFDEHPATIFECAKKIKILNVNQATLSLFKFGNKEKLLTDVSEFLGEPSMRAFKEELVTLAEGNIDFAGEIHQKRSDGKMIIGDLRISIAPGYEDTWEKVYVSIMEVTERVKLEKQLKDSLEKMEILATTDPLTGLLNRRAIIDYAEAELARAERQGTALGLALVDMDNLKEINDRHGHIMGDLALRRVGQTLKESCRIYDKVGRWGGDEFLVVIPAVESKKVLKTAKRLKATITDASFDNPNGVEIYLGACFGVTCAPAGNIDNHTVDALLVIADKALYHAKGLGRNEIVFFDIDST
jgi:diguanylate cyclase (GGDEF)-like protein/PAS domain S-box-containing protein